MKVVFLLLKNIAIEMCRDESGYNIFCIMLLH